MHTLSNVICPYLMSIGTAWIIDPSSWERGVQLLHTGTPKLCRDNGTSCVTGQELR